MRKVTQQNYNSGLLSSSVALLKRAWNSPTLTAWAAFTNSAASFLLLAPLLLSRFEAAELAVFYLFQSFMALVSLIDFGFAPTFMRLLAYGRAGRKLEELEDLRFVVEKKTRVEPNWETIEQLVSVMRSMYRKLALIATAIALVTGPLLLMRPISLVSDPLHAWVAFGLIIVSSVRIIYRRVYGNYLRALNHQALANRWQAMTGGIGVLSSIVVIRAGGELLAVVCSLQVWALIGSARVRWLALSVDGSRLRAFVDRQVSPSLKALVWERAWRSGVGATALSGFSQSFGLVLAQSAEPNTVAGYLFASRILDTLRKFAMAGFSPQIPRLAMLRAAGRLVEQANAARRNMRITNWAFVLPVIMLGLIGPQLFEAIDSKIEFPVLLLWTLLAFKEQLLRVSLMHMNIYQITNHIVSHKVMWVLAGSQAILCYALYPWLHIYALPIGCVLGTVGPMWWLCQLSYRSMNVTFWAFERGVSIGPVAALVVFMAYSVLTAV